MKDGKENGVMNFYIIPETRFLGLAIFRFFILMYYPPFAWLVVFGFGGYIDIYICMYAWKILRSWSVAWEGNGKRHGVCFEIFHLFVITKVGA